MIAPASANVIGKLAHGIADDMLTTTVMACKCKKIISPAMNVNMFENPIVQDNLKIFRALWIRSDSAGIGISCLWRYRDRKNAGTTDFACLYRKRNCLRKRF